MHTPQSRCPAVPVHSFFSTLALSAVLLGLPVAALADTITVGPGGGFDHATIQAAIDTAFDGDVVLLADGVYTGPGNKDLDYGGRSIMVRSENGPEACIIDCEGLGRGFHFRSGEGPDAVVLGLTIQNGNVAAPGGGGVLCQSSHPSLVNCVLRDNFSFQGGGLASFHSHPTLVNVLFTGNLADAGAAVYGLFSDIMMTNCTVHANTANLAAGGILAQTTFLTVRNSIFWDNVDSGGADQFAQIDWSFHAPNVTHTCVQDDASADGVVYSGVGNTDENPRFRDVHDARLQADSPCLDAGDDTAVPPDLDDVDGDGDTAEATPVDLDGNPRFTGVAVDMGAFEFPDSVGSGDPIEDLVGLLDELDLPHGLDDALRTKVNRAEAAAEHGKYNAAANVLNAFLNQIEAKRGKTIDDADADALIERVENVIASWQ